MATRIVASRPGPQTCHKDRDDPFRGSHITLSAQACSDGICCFTALSDYTPSSSKGLGLKVLVKSRGLHIWNDPCQHLEVTGTIADGALTLSFRCNCYATRPSSCRLYPEQTQDGCSLCTFNEYLASYQAYPFGHWTLYYGFPEDEAMLSKVFPRLGSEDILELIRTDPFCCQDAISGTHLPTVPVPKDRTVLYRSPQHPPAQEFSQILAAWPEAMRRKYRSLYGEVWRHVLRADRKAGKMGRTDEIR